jgi:3-hydroxybutyryl-CoA dehydrogenase
MTSLQTIGVIGAGTMGSGIAQACAVAGLSVTMIEVDEAAVARAAPYRRASIGW